MRTTLAATLERSSICRMVVSRSSRARSAPGRQRTVAEIDELFIRVSCAADPRTGPRLIWKDVCQAARFLSSCSAAHRRSVESQRGEITLIFAGGLPHDQGSSSALRTRVIDGVGMHNFSRILLSTSTDLLIGSISPGQAVELAARGGDDMLFRVAARRVTGGADTAAAARATRGGGKVWVRPVARGASVCPSRDGGEGADGSPQNRLVMRA